MARTANGTEKSYLAYQRILIVFFKAHVTQKIRVKWIPKDMIWSTELKINSTSLLKHLQKVPSFTDSRIFAFLHVNRPAFVPTNHNSDFSGHKNICALFNKYLLPSNC